MGDLRLKEEYNYYIENQEALKKDYLGKFLVIKNKMIMGSYLSLEEALVNALKTEKAGTFLVQLCDEDEQIPTQTFHSRVYFN